MDYEALLHSIGRRVAELRDARGLTQEQLAEHLGFDLRYMQRVEAGTTPVSLRQLARIAEALEAPVVALFEAPQKPDAKPGRPRRKRGVDGA